MLRSLILYFQFFTRIPLPIAIDQAEETYRRGLKYFWLFAAIYSLLLGLAYGLFSLILPIQLAFLCCLVVDFLLTGGFHQDAWADSFDGLLSSRKPDQMLAIMKDSRIGANGALALIFYYLWVSEAIKPLIQGQTLWIQSGRIFLFFWMGKAGLNLLHLHFRYKGANPNGLGSMLVKSPTSGIAISQVIFCTVSILLEAWRGLICYGASMACLWLYRSWVLKKVGGLNGDTVGAGSLASQIAYLFFFNLALRWFL